MRRVRQSKPEDDPEVVAVEPLLPDDVQRLADCDLIGQSQCFLDPSFRRDFEELTYRAAIYVQPGVDLNEHLRHPIQNERVLHWQASSDRLVRELKGRRDLVKKRRRGLLRWPCGPDLGLSYVKPEFAYLPEHSSAVNRVFRLRDELEWMVVATTTTRDPAIPWRPIREVLTHDIVRALLDWKASHLDMYLSAYPHLIGGRICHELPTGSGREHVHEVKFSTTAFMKWYFANMN